MSERKRVSLFRSLEFDEHPKCKNERRTEKSRGAFECFSHEETYLDMFHFWSCLLQQAGYNEWAVALYQALIELNLPENSGDFSQRLERLKRTWDTDKVR